MPSLPETVPPEPETASGTPTARAPLTRATRFGFPFTEADSPAARLRISEDLDLIARVVAAADPAMSALVLTGGFSRGEGTVRDGRPVNDYDLISIRTRPGGDDLYRRLAHELTESVSLEVDLMPVWRRRLPRIGRKLFWLDVALGGQVIAGNVGVLRELPAMSAADLPPQECARLLGNRAAGLLLALPGPDLPPDPQQVDLQAAKAVLAAMDATLLHRRQYAARLRDRLSMCSDHPHHATFAAAVEWKLRGSLARSRVGWEEASAVLLDAVEETGAREVSDGTAEHAVHLLRARRLRRDPSQRLRLVAWELLEKSRFPEGPDPATARRALSRAGRLDEGAVEWATLKKAFFALRAKTLQ